MLCYRIGSRLQYNSTNIELEEYKVGSIEVGKRACLVVLDKDIFTIPVNEIHTIDPVCTYFDGQEYHFPDPLKE